MKYHGMKYLNCLTMLSKVSMIGTGNSFLKNLKNLELYVFRVVSIILSTHLAAVLRYYFDHKLSTVLLNNEMPDFYQEDLRSFPLPRAVKLPLPLIRQQQKVEDMVAIPDWGFLILSGSNRNVIEFTYEKYL